LLTNGEVRLEVVLIAEGELGAELLELGHQCEILFSSAALVVDPETSLDHHQRTGEISAKPYK